MKKLKVNISTPFNWNFDEFLRLHSPGGEGIWDEFQFHHNMTSGFFDVWIVLDQIEETTTLSVPNENIFLVTMEERDVVKGYDTKYLNQFKKIITSRNDISHSSLISSHYFTKWHIKKSFDELLLTLNTSVEKTKNLSAIISSRIQYGEQKKRYEFIKKLKSNLQQDLDWYSKNENPIDDKWEGLSPYKFSIAIENSSHTNYFTEKLVDIILSESIPFYWGAPNVTDYFPSNLIINIDLNDLVFSEKIIRDSISSINHSNQLSLLKEAKKKILLEYQFLPWLSKILRENVSFGSKNYPNKIFRESDIYFSSRIKNIMKKIIQK